jgi:Tol biopolymer transport system component
MKVHGQRSTKAFFAVGGAVMLALFLATASLPSLRLAPEIALAEPGDIVLCSTDASGAQGNGDSGILGYLSTDEKPAISADGRYVAFVSDATNLVPGDTNGCADVFRKDLDSGEIICASTDSLGTQADCDSEHPAISADGRYVVFDTSADLAPNSSDIGTDVYRKDLLTGETRICSYRTPPPPPPDPTPPLDCKRPAISADGRYVVFDSADQGMVADDVNDDWDVIRADMNVSPPTFTLCTTSTTGVQGNAACHHPCITQDGRFVAFDSWADNLVAGDTNSSADVFRKDLQTGETVRCSTDSGGNQASGQSYYAGISDDGRFISFFSSAADLVPDDTNEADDVFRKDLQTGETLRCSTDSSGGEGYRWMDNQWQSMSADGRYVAFTSHAPNLDPPMVYNGLEVFRKDLDSGETIRCCTSDRGIYGEKDSYGPAITADGKYVAFLSEATTLVPGDSNGKVDVFRKEVGEPAWPTWYFAEGCTDGGFETWILVQNPNANTVTVDLLLETNESQEVLPDLQDVHIPPYSRISFNLGSYIVRYSVATIVSSADGMVVCERAMYGNSRAWAHDSIGSTQPSSTWYLAEGCTAGGMETWVMIMNPNGTTVNADVTLMTELGPIEPPELQGIALDPYACGAFDIGRYVQNYDVSTMVTSTGGSVVCERSMYGNSRTWAHNSVGVSSMSAEWYFAEGCTAGGMETWILLQNPNPFEVICGMLLYTDQGIISVDPDDSPYIHIPAGSRRTINLGQYVTSYEVSAYIYHPFPGEEPRPLVCERAMYGGGRAWAHDSIGVTEPSTTWYLAEGCTAGGMETWLLVENPLGEDVEMNITMQTDAGLIAPDELQGYVLPAHSRSTFNLNDYILETYNVSTMVEALGAGWIVVERAMYGNGRTWAHDSIGYSP